MNRLFSRAFIAKIPKTDLHLHLDGSLRLSTLIELAREQGVALPANDEQGLCELVFKSKYANLGEYLSGFGLTNDVMQTSEALERIAYELVWDNIVEGVRYVEIRFAPQLHLNRGLGIKDVVEAVSKGLHRARDEFNAAADVVAGRDLPFEGGLILCAMRCFNAHMGDYFNNLLNTMSYAPPREIFATASLQLARAAVVLVEEHGLPVVGFDLAGEESGYPAIYHKAAFQYVHSHFIQKTVHAGEAYGPESIFQAITECHANRIGHGTHLLAMDMIRDPNIRDPQRYVQNLLEYIANRRITLEVCLTSNMQTIPAIQDLALHPLKQMLEHNLSISICTDNRLVSHTTVSRELELLVEYLDVTPAQLRNILVAGFKGSFYPGRYNDKRAYVRKVINRYDELEKACACEDSTQN